MVLSGYSARMCTIDKEECTPLHYAASTGDVKCCKFLAQRGTVREHRPQIKVVVEFQEMRIREIARFIDCFTLGAT